jgi:hypothetical protein
VSGQVFAVAGIALTLVAVALLIWPRRTAVTA